MPRSFSAVSASVPVRSLDDLRPEMAKASLPVQPGPTALGALVTEAIERTGPKKEAAADMDLDQSQMNRQVAAGQLTLGRIERLKPATKVELGRLLVETYAPLVTPKARIQQKAREQRALAEELEQIAEYL